MKLLGRRDDSTSIVRLVTIERVARAATAEESRESGKSGLTLDVGGATCQECGDLELQEEYGREISQAQSDRLERGAEGEERLLPRRDLGGVLHASASA